MKCIKCLREIESNEKQCHYCLSCPRSKKNLADPLDNPIVFLSILIFIALLILLHDFKLPIRKFSKDTYFAKIINTASDSCMDKEKCFLIYLTPWCPHCRSEVSTINKIAAEIKPSKKTGLRVVIGMDNLSALEKFAAEFKAPVFLDTDGAVYSTFQSWFSGVPSACTLNNKKEIQSCNYFALEYEKLKESGI